MEDTTCQSDMQIAGIYQLKGWERAFSHSVPTFIRKTHYTYRDISWEIEKGILLLYLNVALDSKKGQPSEIQGVWGTSNI